MPFENWLGRLFRPKLPKKDFFRLTFWPFEPWLAWWGWDFCRSWWWWWWCPWPVVACGARSTPLISIFNCQFEFSLFWRHWFIYRVFLCSKASINNAAWHTWTVTISISNLSHCSISTTSECRAHLTSFLFTLVTTSPSLSPARFAFPSANQRQKTFFSLYSLITFHVRNKNRRVASDSKSKAIWTS